MPLHLPPCYLGPTETNIVVGNRDGATLTASATPHTKGSYGSLVDPVAQECNAITVAVSGVAATGAATSCLLDIAIGPTGGGSEQVVIPNLDCWGAPTNATLAAPKAWTFPLHIPKGKRVSGRIAGLVVSETAEVAVWLHQRTQGWGMQVPSVWEQLGTITSSNGPSVTPGSGAFGTAAAILDPITKSYRWWHVGYGALSDISIATGGTSIVRLGFGNTTLDTTIGDWMFASSTLESIAGPFPAAPVFFPVQADTVNGVYAQIASFETEARSVVAYAAV